MKASERDLVALVQAFDAAWNAHDPDAVLAFCAEDIVFKTGPPPLTVVAAGKQQVRSFLVGILPSLHVESWNHRVRGCTVSFSYRHSSEHFQNMGIDQIEGLAETIFQGGKIKSFTGTVSSETMEKLWTALE